MANRFKTAKKRRKHESLLTCRLSRSPKLAELPHIHAVAHGKLSGVRSKLISSIRSSTDSRAERRELLLRDVTGAEE
jgi:hypothetical protein